MNDFNENKNIEDAVKLNRWRLMLGKYADSQIGFGEGGIGGAGGVSVQEMDDVLDFIYSREYGEEEGVRDQA